jgi:hypothetical protein
MKVNELKRKARRLDPGILVALIICGLAIWPFVSRVSLPQATDAELHIFRVAELDRLLRAGEIFPRWAPNFYYGFGYPIFNYYAPLAYYVALVPGLLLHWDAVTGVKFVFVLGILLGGLGTYGFAVRNWGRMPALVATAAYVYAPFIVFVDPHARGDLAEAFSFAVFPLALWAMESLRRRPRAWSWLLAVVFVALLILSHNLMALVFAAILAGWGCWQLIFSGVPMPPSIRTGWSERLLRFRLLIALIAGIGVAAFFWLTVALEQDAVNLGSLIGQGDNFDYRNHFLSFTELLSPPAIMDWAATEPDFLLGLGPLQWILARIGLIALVTGRAIGKKQAAYFAVVAGILVFLMLPVSQVIWDFVPFLPFLQFPWRLLGPTAFALAILSAVATASMMSALARPIGRWLPALLIGLLVLGALPLSQLPPWSPDFGPTTALRVLEEELAGKWLGTTSTSDFVPTTVDTVPGPEDALLADFFAGRTLDRVNRVTLPAATAVKSEQISPLKFRYEVKSDSDFLLRLFLFDFPGWEARIDGDVAATELGRPEGFLVVPVKAGEHVVEVTFGDTTARKVATAVSGLSLLLAGVYALWLRRNRSLLPESEFSPPVETVGGASELMVISAVVILLFGANALLVEPRGWLRLDSPNLSAIPAENDFYAELDGQFALIGYDAPERAISGSTVSFTAYWQALVPAENNYQVFVHLLDEQGQLVAQADALNPGEFPTERWPTDRYVRDEHDIVLADELPPGRYRWSIGLWLAEDGSRLPHVDDAGRVIDSSIYLPFDLTVE